VKHVWILTLVVALYAIAIGLFANATPQVCLALAFDSKDLGLIGTCNLTGYAAGCLLWGRVLRRIPGKRVMLAGIAGTGLAMLAMAQLRSVPACAAAQFCSGLSGGAVWPFAAAWMLDFQRDRIAKTRLLRHYNVAWTSGTAAGLFLAGPLCQRGWRVETIYAAAAVLLAAWACAWMPRGTAPGRDDDATPEAAPRVPRVALPLLLAAVLANVAAVGTRSVLLNNYAELNQALGFGADRMGWFTSLMLVGQILAFGAGRWYEPWLGSRRAYAALAATLIAVLLVFACHAALPLLLPAAVVGGLAMAASFQASLLASTGHFARARIATSFHEAMVGVGGIMPLPAGWLATTLRRNGLEALDALRAPYAALAVLALLGFAAQCALVSRARTPRTLLGPEPSGGEGRPAAAGRGTARDEWA
jgi:MFS family permease